MLHVMGIAVLSGTIGVTLLGLSPTPILCAGELGREAKKGSSDCGSRGHENRSEVVSETGTLLK